MALIDRRCTTVDQVARWIWEVHDRNNEPYRQVAPSPMSTQSTRSTYPEIAANAALVLIAMACGLLDRQLAAQAETFEKEGGFTERLYKRRIQARGRNR